MEQPAEVAASEDQEFGPGDQLPDGCEVISVHVGELQQLFNALDASPFGKKDLSESVEEYIVSWAREAPRHAAVGLIVQLDQPMVAGAPSLLRNAIRRYFAERATATRQRLRQLFRRGRISLAIGVVFLAISLAAGGLVETALAGVRSASLVRESLLIAGWVAMWRPLEIFLYDWWPIRDEAWLFDRLSVMLVRIEAAHLARHDSSPRTPS